MCTPPSHKGNSPSQVLQFSRGWLRAVNRLGDLYPAPKIFDTSMLSPPWHFKCIRFTGKICPDVYIVGSSRRVRVDFTKKSIVFIRKRFNPSKENSIVTVYNSNNLCKRFGSVTINLQSLQFQYISPMTAKAFSFHQNVYFPLMHYLRLSLPHTLE